MKPSLLQQKILLTRAQNGDADAYGEIYDLYVDKIYRFIFFKVSNHEEAEDLTAEVFLKTWQYISEPDNRRVGNLNALLYQTARNKVIDYYRSSNKKEILTGDESLKLIEDSRQQNLLEAVEISSEIEKVESYLNKLKDEYREVIILKFVDELSTREIAQVLDKTTGATRVLIHRAMRILKEVINTDDDKKQKYNQ